MDRERPSHTFLELCKYNHMQGNFLFRISIRIICRYILENSFERVTIFCFWSSSFSTAFLPKLSIKEKPCLIQVCLHRPNDGLTGSEPANSSNYCFNFVQEHFIITSPPPHPMNFICLSRFWFVRAGEVQLALCSFVGGLRMDDNRNNKVRV